MNSEKKKILESINQKLNSNFKQTIQSKFLITGKALTGKTFFSLQLQKYFLEQNYNTILLTGNNIENNKSFKHLFHFFQLSYLQPTSKLVIPINKKSIQFDFSNFDYREQDLITFTTIPYKNTYQYKNLFITPEYYILDKYFISNYQKNILIIDNIDHIDLSILYFINFSLQKLYNNSLFFGGLNIIFLGNVFNQHSFLNFFDSGLYFHNFNIISDFIKYNLFDTPLYSIQNTILYNNQTFYWSYQPIFDFTKKYTFSNTQYKPLSITNLLKDFYSRDVDRNTQIKKIFLSNPDSIFLTHNSTLANNLNLDKLSSNNITSKSIYAINRELVWQDFSDEDINLFHEKYQTNFEYILKTCFKHVSPTLFLKEKSKIIFTTNIPSLSIFKGDFGFIHKIDYPNSSLNSPLSDLNLPDNSLLNKKNIIILNNIHSIKITVFINNQYHIIPLSEYTSIDAYNKKLILYQFPFILGWYISPPQFKLIHKIPKLIIHFEPKFPFPLLVEAILKTDIQNCAFRNTFLLHNLEFFSISLFTFEKQQLQYEIL